VEDLTREDFERNMNIFLEMIRQGKLVLPQGFSGDSLLRVHKTPNGRIDFLTVDEEARSTGNMMAWTTNDFFKKIYNDFEMNDDKE